MDFSYKQFNINELGKISLLTAQLANNIQAALSTNGIALSVLLYILPVSVKDWPKWNHTRDNH